MQKPYRFLVSRVASYVEEANAFLRRRRLRSQPFVRIWRPGGAIEAPDPRSEPARELFTAAIELLGDE